MSSFTRRDWLTAVSAAAATVPFAQETSAGADDRQTLFISTFRVDATSPPGQPCCGGWIKPIEAVDDSQEILGLVIQGSGKPIVICSVDWTGILNEAHLHFRSEVARAVGTDAERVAVQCVHQHNAPFTCLEAQAIVAQHKDLPPLTFIGFFHETVQRVAAAAKGSLTSARPLTHVATGEAEVFRVAGNRRILKPDGTLMAMRGSGSRSQIHADAPEGLIDRQLKTVAFFSGETKVAVCHYYACHPMSYYGDGRASSDFVGLARKKRQAEEPDCTHIYFSGCGGNIAAGKYNDATHEMRPVLVRRMYDAIVASEQKLERQPVTSVEWSAAPVLLTPDPKWNEAEILAQIADPKRKVVDRNRPAYVVSYLRRFRAGQPIIVSALHVNDVSLLHLPAECFVEYQLRAQQEAKGRFVACAAYGDGGPWYIPTAEQFPLGGYEVSMSWCGPTVDQELWGAATKALRLA
jgi:hypothetical protein